MAQSNGPGCGYWPWSHLDHVIILAVYRLMLLNIVVAKVCMAARIDLAILGRIGRVSLSMRENLLSSQEQLIVLTVSNRFRI